MKTVTVFTPTYNRAHLLPRLYKSLRSQTSSDFCWLIIDDGSSDHTKELVEKWKDEDRVEIEYIYKENGGMHTAHNLAAENIETAYCVCVDSDDYLLSDSVLIINEIIRRENLSADNSLAGLVGINITPGGRIVGSNFPTERLICKYQDIADKYRAVGDKKIVFKSALFKALEPYPQFYPERFVPLYHPLLLDMQYDYLCVNDKFCIVEYQQDGSTVNIYQQYFANPKGFRHARVIEMKTKKRFFQRFKSAVHLVTCNLILKESNLIKSTPHKLLAISALPMGILWYLYIFINRKKHRNITKYIQ